MLNTCRYTIVAVVAFTLSAHTLKAQMRDTISSRWRSYIELDKYIKPFWQADTIYDETLLPLDDSGTVHARLLYKAATILSVKSANYAKTYTRGKDWEMRNGRLVILPGSGIPLTSRDELVFKTYRPDLSMQGKTSGTFVLFTEKPFFSGLQIAVTYIKAKGETWSGTVPRFAKDGLSNTLIKLRNKEDLKVVFYGNSIEAGFNTSDHMGTPPYMPTWPELIIYKLRRSYGNKISYVNLAVPGKLAAWGLEQVDTRIVPEKPDLVIIGFGMNDGAANIAPESYRKDIEEMIRRIRSQHAQAEFILIAPMLANPDAIQSGIQATYKSELDRLACQGTVVADMTKVHTELLQHKAYQDMTGNNVNHPNDYLARWYAQIILALLIK